MLEFRTFYMLQLVKSLLLSIPEACIKKDARFGPSLPVNRPLVSLRNRTAKRLCVTNVTGLSLACFVVIFR